MSRVTDVILIVDPADDAHVEDISFWLASDEPRTDDRTTARVGALLPLTGAMGEELWGGHKAFGFSLWGAVTNHLDRDRCLERVETTQWGDAERVQLLVKDDGDTFFRLYMFSAGKLSNFSPPDPAGD